MAIVLFEEGASDESLAKRETKTTEGTGHMTGYWR